MKVIILRGISGAGKSTWARTNAPSAVLVSADSYFLQADGSYVFDGEKLHDAHKQCYREFVTAMEQKSPLIVVDNSGITVWEISPYVMPAQAFGYEVEILTFVCDPEVAIQRKDWQPPDEVRAAAIRLAEQTNQFPEFMKRVHRIIE